MGHYVLHIMNSRSGPMQAFFSGLSVAAIRTMEHYKFVGDLTLTLCSPCKSFCKITCVTVGCSTLIAGNSPFT